MENIINTGNNSSFAFRSAKAFLAKGSKAFVTLRSTITMVKKSLLFLVVATVLATGFVSAATFQTENKLAVPDGHSDSKAHVAIEDVSWVNAFSGVQLAHTWSEDATGARWFIKIDAGVSIPTHSHTSDYWGTTIRGNCNWAHIHDDGSETNTGPGDYALVKGGELHGDRCDSCRRALHKFTRFCGPTRCDPTQITVFN